MNWIYFYTKRNYLLVKAFFNKKSLVNGSDTYFYKWNRIHNLRKLYNISNLIETGTYYGLTVSKFSNYFDKIFSVEIDKSLYEKNKLFFSKKKNIEILFGDSKAVLPNILDRYNDKNNLANIIFWLDGHCSEGETGKGDEYSPLLNELAVILKYLTYIKPIIIIDDVRLFDGVQYPTFESIKNFFLVYDFNLNIDNDGLIIIDNRILHNSN
jgi:hypothetical protein